MTHQTVTAKQSGSRFRFIGEIIAELKKVTWLKWPQEVLYLTLLVLVVSIVAGLILGFLDFGFAELVERIFLGK